MKKIFVFLSLIVLATSCDWFVFDNQEYYNASVEGKLLDTKTGQPLQFAFPLTETLYYGSGILIRHIHKAPKHAVDTVRVDHCADGV